MGVQINFDSSQVPPSTGVMDAMPAGWYIAAMDQSEAKPTKNNEGVYLECRFDILDGQYKGRKVFARLNVKNSNPQAVEIAYRDLSAICHAVGAVGMVQTTDMLHGRPLKIKLSVRPATPDYEAQNEIKAYRNVNDQSAVNGAPGGAVNTGMPQGFGMPPGAQGGQGPWGAPQGAAPGPQQGYTPPQQQPQGQPTYTPPAQPQGGAAQGWQPPAGGQPWQSQQPQGQQPQQQFQQPQGQQPAQQPQQTFAPAQQQPVQQQPQNQNPAANQPPPWA